MSNATPLAATFDIPRAAELLALVRDRLPEKIAAHSISTAQVLNNLDVNGAFTKEQAVTAGLIHDIAKGMKGKELLVQAKEYGIPVTDIQELKPKLLHGPVSAEWARRELGIDDETIYEAVYWHTTGRPDLCRLGLALYFADYAEPLRRRAEAVHARDILAREGLIPAVRFVSKNKLAYVRTKPPVDAMTEAFDEWLTAEQF